MLLIIDEMMNFRTNVDDEYRKSTNAKRVRSDITKTRQVF